LTKGPRLLFIILWSDGNCNRKSWNKTVVRNLSQEIKTVR